VPDNKHDENQQWIFIETPAPYGRVEPISGRNYYIENVGRERFLDLACSRSDEGNFVITWNKNSPPTANQVWHFTGSGGRFTIQNLSTLNAKNLIGGNDGGPEGHLHIEVQQNEKTVIGSVPFHWALELVGSGIYKLLPAKRPEMALTCVTDQLNGIPECAAKLEVSKANDETQCWVFIPAIEV